MNSSSVPVRPAILRGAAAMLLLLSTAPGTRAGAAGQVAGVVQIGPSWAQADPAHSSARLSTIIANHGEMADRLIRVACPTAGQVALRNGTLHEDVQAPTTDQQRAAIARRHDPNGDHTPQNGLDLPPALHDKIQPLTAEFDLSQARQPLTDGALIPCSVYFAHAGQRIVIFTIGEQPTPTDEP